MDRSAHEKENGWFRVSPDAGKAIGLGRIFLVGLASWVAALLIGFFVSAAWFGSLDAALGGGPGQQGLVLVLDLIGALLGGFVLILLGTPVVRVQLKSGKFGIVPALTGCTFIFWLSSSIPLGWMQPYEAIIWSIHHGTCFGPITSAFFWSLLATGDRGLVPEAEPAALTKQILLSAGVLLIGQILSYSAFLFIFQHFSPK